MTTMVDVETGELMTEIDLGLLTEEFPTNALMHRDGPGGKQFTYVSTATVIRRLNRATHNQWSFAVIAWQMLPGGVRIDKYHGNAEIPQQIMLVHGRLTIPGLGSRDGFGVQRLDDPITNTDDLLKAAQGDALKRAAVSFGVAIELYGDDLEAEGYHPPAPQRIPQQRPAPAAAAPPQGNGARPERAAPASVGTAPGQDPNGQASPYAQVYDLYTKMDQVRALMKEWQIPVNDGMKMPDCAKAVNAFIKQYYHVENGVVPTGLYNAQYNKVDLRPCDIANALAHFTARESDPAPEATRAAAEAQARDTTGERDDFADIPF